jgi:hypothetical protein
MQVRRNIRGKNNMGIRAIEKKKAPTQWICIRIQTKHNLHAAHSFDPS